MEKMLKEDCWDFIELSDIINNNQYGTMLNQIPATKMTRTRIQVHDEQQKKRMLGLTQSKNKEVWINVFSSVELIGALLGATLSKHRHGQIKKDANELLRHFCLVCNNLVFYTKDWQNRGHFIYLKTKELELTEDKNFVYATCKYDLYLDPVLFGTSTQPTKIKMLDNEDKGYTKHIKTVSKKYNIKQPKYGTNFNVTSWKAYEDVMEYVKNNLFNKLETHLTNSKRTMCIPDVCTGSLAINKKFLEGEKHINNNSFKTPRGQSLINNRNWFLSSVATQTIRTASWEKEKINITCKQQFHFDNIKPKASHRLTYDIENDEQLLVQMVSDKHSKTELLELTKQHLIENKYETHESMDLMGDKILNTEWDSELPRINLDNLVSIKAVKNWTKNLVRIDDATESSHGDNLLKIAKMTNEGVYQIETTSIMTLRHNNKKFEIPSGKYILTLNEKPDLIQYLKWIPASLENIEAEIKKSRLSSMTSNVIEIDSSKVERRSRRSLSSEGIDIDLGSEKTKRRTLSKQDD